ncbi:hypothetical protein VB773_04070 [Haloarculaceae archaeon H-GB2-1]|nr:hypothetical protein [Haloarculaceae archaeon H-GB11]MEA5406834.1 hypothetical protein [Haloarculaceae archaeon H-GB2-1]
METDSVSELLKMAAKRHDFLLALHDGILSKSEMEQSVDASRPTIDRAFRELEDAGLLSSQGTSYELTNFGYLFCDQFSQTVRTYETLSDARTLLSHLLARRASTCDSSTARTSIRPRSSRHRRRSRR